MNKQTLAATTLAVGAAAGIGSVASRPRVTGWYSRLRKPGYVPPNGVFPVAWTSLYTDIAVTSAYGDRPAARSGASGRGAQLRRRVGRQPDPQRRMELAVLQVPQARRFGGWRGGAGSQQRRPDQADRRGRSARRRRAVAVSAVVCLCHCNVGPYLGTQSTMRQVAR